MLVYPTGIGGGLVVVGRKGGRHRARVRIALYEEQRIDVRQTIVIGASTKEEGEKIEKMLQTFLLIAGSEEGVGLESEPG